MAARRTKRGLYIMKFREKRWQMLHCDTYKLRSLGAISVNLGLTSQTISFLAKLKRQRMY